MRHDIYVGVTTAQFGIDDYQANSPVGYTTQNDEENETSEKTGLTNSVRQTWSRKTPLEKNENEKTRQRSLPMIPKLNEYI